MRVVVTGALGHIGSRLIRELAVAWPGAEVVMVDNLATERYASLFNLPDGCHYEFVEGDVLTADLIGCSLAPTRSFTSPRSPTVPARIFTPRWKESTSTAPSEWRARARPWASGCCFRRPPASMACRMASSPKTARRGSAAAESLCRMEAAVRGVAHIARPGGRLAVRHFSDGHDLRSVGRHALSHRGEPILLASGGRTTARSVARRPRTSSVPTSICPMRCAR